jgi:anti-sigma B factor antagonist
MELSISTRNIEPDIHVIELSGRVTMGRESTRIQPLVASFLTGGGSKIIFDVSGVTYIDSSGMGQIAQAAGKVLQAGAKCRVAGAKGLVLDVFRITRIDSIVPFAPSVEEAVAALSAA